MVVDDLDIVRVTVLPTETDTPLVVYTDAVLALAIATQRLKPVTRRNQQVLKCPRPVEVEQLPSCLTLDHPEPRHQLIPKKQGGVAVAERTDHINSLLRNA
jgi:hypothetical protein